MNDFRIPPHSEVKLVFARKVLREEFRDEVVSLNPPCTCSFHVRSDPSIISIMYAERAGG